MGFYEGLDRLALKKGWVQKGKGDDQTAVPHSHILSSSPHLYYIFLQTDINIIVIYRVKKVVEYVPPKRSPRINNKQTFL